jgi:hypothetical protein
LISFSIFIALEDHEALAFGDRRADGHRDLHDLAGHLGLDALRPGRGRSWRCRSAAGSAFVACFEMEELAARRARRKPCAPASSMITSNCLPFLDDRVDRPVRSSRRRRARSRRRS